MPVYRLLHLSIPLQMALSMALWWPGADRIFPALPLVDMLGATPFWVSGVLSTVLVLITVAYAWGEISAMRFVPTALVLGALLVSLDLNRLQVWVWMWFLLWLADMAGGQKDEKSSPFSLHAWVIAGIYAWGGLHKMTPWFSTNFDWFCEAFPVTTPLSGNIWLTYAAAIFEFLLAPLLLWRRTRRVGIGLAILLHGYILLVIGPLGYWYNVVVWPWNITMMGLVVYYFNGEEPVFFPLHLEKGVIWALVWVMPALNIWGYWPESLSWKMYANTQREATIYAPKGSPCEKLAPIWQKYATDGQYLLIDDWSSEELHVPAFNSTRNFKRVLQWVQNCTQPADTTVQLKVLTVSRWSRAENLQLETTY